ncbi:MAG: phage tail length tape measure family protein [Alphaproteobacteria bacterium]|nr:phage tail length tape measure family protein [Alphaproteobacteria bacterium]
MADLANVVVKGEFDGQELIAGLKAVSQYGKRAATDSDLLNKAIGKLSGVMETMGGDVKSAFNTLSQGFDNLSKKVDEQTQTFNKLASAVNKAKKETKEFNDVQKQAASISDSMMGNTTRGAAQANRFNSANFLAQFQDIAVTSAMGMNPLLIAVQQGTQLQYILAQSKAPLKDFVAGLKSMFSVAGMLTIGLTGVAAALIQLVDWSKVGKTILGGLGSVFTWLGNVTQSLNISALGQHFKDLAEDIKEAEEAAKGFNKILKDFEGFEKKLASKRFELSLEGKTEAEKAKLRAEHELSEMANKIILENKEDLSVEELDDIQFRMKVLTDEAVRLAEEEGKIKDNVKKAAEAKKEEEERLRKAAKAAEADAQAVKKLAEAWDRLNTSALNKISDLKMEQSLIGAGTYEKTYVETLNNLKRQAESSGIDLNSSAGNGKTVYETLDENAKATALLTEENERLNKTYEFGKSTVKGFFSDMRQGLRDGQSAWEAFGDAVTNVLDKILDKIMDIGVDALFNAGRSAGWFNFGSGQQVYNSPIGPTMPGATPLTGQALGGAWDKGIQKFARGGVVSSPTMFAMRSGLGVMGEAGPEAVMPLTRGPDGSLGVRADGNNSSPVIVNVVNNSNAQAKVEQRQTSQGMEIDVMIDQLVAEKMNQPGTSSNSALRAFNNQKLIAR